MLNKLLHPSLRYVAGLVSIILVESAFLSSSGVVMTTAAHASTSSSSPRQGRGRDNHFYHYHHHYRHHHPEYHTSSEEEGDGAQPIPAPSPPTPGPWFEQLTDVLPDSSNPVQRNYGVAVSDVDNDGELEIIVAGNSGPNLVLKYNNTTQRLENIAVDDPSSPFYALRDPRGNAIGVAACDVDGDGREEIYVLNTNAYSGPKSYGDKLFKLVRGRYVDVLADPINANVLAQYAGRSVACIDRLGTGRYSLYLSNYVDRWGRGPCAMVEMDPDQSDVPNGRIKIRNVAREVGVERKTGGRGVTVAPILNDEGRSDIFCDNEWGPNFLYKNNGRGGFSEVAVSSGVADVSEHGRGVAVADFNEDGLLDITYGNWNGDHRLFLQRKNGQRRTFENVASHEFEEPSPIRTVIAADFDNDGILEIFMNNIAYHSSAPNRLYKVIPDGEGDVTIEEVVDIGSALEPTGHGTGGAVTDFNNDGRLELIVSHGESASEPVTIYRASEGAANGWLRIMPLTRFGAPARGALVKVTSRDGRSQLRVVDGGSGYLCQMEPVAHFGFGDGAAETPVSVEVKWPDTRRITRQLRSGELNSVIRIAHPGDQVAAATGQGRSDDTTGQTEA